MWILETRDPSICSSRLWGERIEVVTTSKYLGVHLEHKLDWSEQIQMHHIKKKGKADLFLRNEKFLFYKFVVV